MRFNNPELLWLLILPLLLLFMFAWLNRRAKARLERFAPERLITRLAKTRSNSRRGWKQITFTAAVVLLLLALARPQLGVEPREVKRTGVDIMIALDASYSMAAEDIAPSRLAKAKQEIGKLADAFEGNRIGLLVFAGESKIESPLTFDITTFKLFLGAVGLNSAGRGGTDLSGAIRKGAASLSGAAAKSRALVIITDGEDNVGDPLGEAKKAAAKGIRIYTIGIGSGSSVPIPIRDENGKLTGYKKDKNGNIVKSRLNSGPLRDIALHTDALYISSSAGNLDLAPIIESINKLEKSDIKSTRFTSYVERFQFFLAGTALLLFIEFLL
ncbi:MAG: VWA domain-containing protein [Nitrospinota bacterium]